MDTDRLEEKIDRLARVVAETREILIAHTAKEDPFQQEIREKVAAVDKKLDEHLAEHLAMKRSALATGLSVLKVVGGWLAAGAVFAWHWFQTIDHVVYKK